MKMDITTTGFDELNVKLRTNKTRIERSLPNALARDIAFAFRNNLRTNMPKKSGRMAAGIDQLNVSPGTYAIWTSAWTNPNKSKGDFHPKGTIFNLARLVNYGARPHTIRTPYARIWHPGFKGKNFWKKSIKDTKDMIPTIARRRRLLV